MKPHTHPIFLIVTIVFRIELKLKKYSTFVLSRGFTRIKKKSQSAQLKCHVLFKKSQLKKNKKLPYLGGESGGTLLQYFLARESTDGRRRAGQLVEMLLTCNYS